MTVIDAHCAKSKTASSRNNPKLQYGRILLRRRVADHSHNDPHKTDLADRHAARAYAQRIIQELKEGGYHPSEATMTVRNEVGNTLYSITL
jgi:Domain of unknown function (DUF6894)